MEKLFSFVSVEQHFASVFRFSCCLSFSSCGTHIPTFWIFHIAFKRMETTSRIKFNCCLWASSSPNSASFTLRFLRQNRRIWFFFKPLKALWFTNSMLTVTSTSIRCRSSFLQIVPNKSLASAVSRRKIRHVHRRESFWLIVFARRDDEKRHWGLRYMKCPRRLLGWRQIPWLNDLVMKGSEPTKTN